MKRLLRLLRPGAVDEDQVDEWVQMFVPESTEPDKWYKWGEENKRSIRRFHRQQFFITVGGPCLIALLIGVVWVLVAAQSAHAATNWGPRADAALTKALATDTGRETPYTNAALARAIAYRSPNGWNDPRVASYLAKVRAARITTGKWGLGYAYDAFQDGTTNPASTSYLITNVDHVGPVLLDAYKAGKATRTEVEDILKIAVAWPKVHNGGDGVCLAYSNSPNDAGANKCVHNVNQATAAFFRQATDTGIVVSGMLLLRIQIARYEAATYLPTSYNWRYIERPNFRLNGGDYQAVGAKWAWLEAPAIGRATVNYSLGRTWPEPTGALAHAWLAPYSCVGGDNWLAEFDRYVASPPPGQSPANRLAQAAEAAARAAATCDS